MNKKKCRFLVYAVALAAGMSAVPGTAGADPVESDAAVVSDAVVDDLSGQPASEVPASASDVAVEEGAVKGEARPDDQAIRESIQKFDGLTLAEINFAGGSEQTRATAQAATSLRAGDAFTADALDKDAEAIMNTGYFVDFYPSFEQVPEGIVLTYHLQEYPVYRGVEFSGNTVVSTEELKKMVTLREGESFNGITFHKNMQAVEDKYHEEGYIQARIVDMHQTADGIIQVKVNEGVLEGFKVKGNEKTKEYVILREMRLKPGEPFNAKQARRSIQRVQNLGFFEDVNVKILPGVDPNAIVMEIDVKEKRTGTFGVGAGYSSQDGIIGMVSVSDTNFRGTGDAVSVIYEMSGDDTDARGYSFSYRHPWLDRKETALTLRLYNRSYDYNDYDTDGDLKEEYMRKYSGGEITLSRPISEYSTNYLTLRNRKDSYEKHLESGNAGDRSTEAGDAWREANFGTTRSITFQHVTDTRDNIYEPTEGGRVSLTAEIGGFGGDFSFRKASIEDQRYYKVGHSQVVATRLAYGIGSGDISEFNQFKVGGQDTLRGYRDDQFRGNRMFMGTLEYRFPLVSKVQGAIFTDWGSAWDGGFKPKDLHGSVGIGLALNTPLGPLRLDYGRRSGGGRVHFSVGGTF